MDDNQDKFQQVVGDSYGQVEAALGSEAYQAQVAHQKGMTRAMLMHEEANLIRARAWSGFVFYIALATLLVVIPFTVILWNKT